MVPSEGGAQKGEVSAFLGMEQAGLRSQCLRIPIHPPAAFGPEEAPSGTYSGRQALWGDGQCLHVPIPHLNTEACPCLGLQCLPPYMGVGTRRSSGAPAEMGWVGWSCGNVGRAPDVELNEKAFVNCLAQGLAHGRLSTNRNFAPLHPQRDLDPGIRSHWEGSGRGQRSQDLK